MKNVLLASFRDGLAHGGPTAEKWLLFESTWLWILVASLLLAGFAFFGNQLNLLAILLGVASGICLSLLHIFAVAGFHRTTVAMVLIFVLILAFGAILDASQPLWAVLCNAFGGIFLVLGTAACFTRHFLNRTPK